MAMVPMVSAESNNPVIQIGEPNLVTDNPSDINETHYQIIAGIQQSNLASTEKTELITTLNEIWSNQSSLSSDEQQKIMIRAASVLLGRTQVVSPQWGRHRARLMAFTMISQRFRPKNGSPAVLLRSYGKKFAGPG